MNRIFSLLAKQQPTTFRVSYAPEYKTFIVNHIATDPSHPLHEAQKRRQRERRREGLWWHVTAGVDLNKSSCVRTWARRRLRNAVKDELQQRGYDDTGKLVGLEAVQQRPDAMHLLRQGKSLDLTGSLRFHVQPPLIPAKYAQLRAETGQVIDIMLQGLKKDSAAQGSVRKTTGRPQQKSPLGRTPQAQGKKTRPDRQMP